MGYANLDDGILQSSIMREDSDTFKIFIILLAAAKADHVARVSEIYLESVSRLPMEKVLWAIKKLESTDDFSRSKEDGGRRIRRIDGGFFIINHEKYREFWKKGDPNSPGALRVKRYRERYSNVTGVTVTLPADAYVSSSISSLQEEFTKLWDAWPVKEGYDEALGEFSVLRGEGITLEDIEKAWAGEMEFLKHERLDNHFDRRPKNLATWLSGGKWKANIGFKRKPRL